MLNVNSGDNGFHRWNQGQFFEMVLKVIYVYIHMYIGNHIVIAKVYIVYTFDIIVIDCYFSFLLIG